MTRDDFDPDALPTGGVPTVDVDDFDPGDVAHTALRSHGDKIMRAVESAAWHTLIDGAGHEVFPPRFDPKYMREVIRRVESGGYGKTDTTAFYAGDQAFGAVEEHHDLVAADARGDVFNNYAFNGYQIVRATTAPDAIILFVDPAALYRVPPEVISRHVGGESNPTVSSPIGVRDPGGVAVVNIDLTD